MNNKPKVPLCWWYDRKDLIEPFLQLREEFEFTVLFYRFKEQESLSFDFPFPRFYWTDFSSPYKFLDLIKPNRIVFMGIENLLSISMNIAAKKRNIPTIYLAHGITYSLEDAIKSAKPEVQTLERYKIDNPAYHKKKYHSIQFYFNCLRQSNIQVFPFLVKYLIASFKLSNVHLRLQSCKSPHRLANEYILYAPAYKNFFIERDGVAEEHFKFIGPYPLDSLFESFKTKSDGIINNYWLFIDQPLSSLSWQQRIQVFKSVGKQAYAKKFELKVKLHPMDYERQDLPSIEGLSYVKGEMSMNELILKSALCIGFYSALLLPVITYMQVLVIDPGNSKLVLDWEKTGAVYYTNLEDLLSDKFSWDIFNSVLRKDEFINKYVFQADGNGKELLKTELLCRAKC